MTDDLEDLTYEEAMKAVAEEIDLRRRDVLIGQANEVYENLIKVSKMEKKCQACSRHLNDKEMATMEKTASPCYSSVHDSAMSKQQCFVAQSTH